MRALEYFDETRKNKERRKELKALKEEHLRDAELCQDALYWAFQKSYQQLGRPYQDWTGLEIHDLIV